MINIKNSSTFKHALRPLSTALAFLMSLQANISAAKDEVAKLPTIVVKEKFAQKMQGYQSGKTTIGKMSQAAKEIPQSLTIINRNLIEDRNATSIKDALRNVAGLTFNAAEGGRIGDNITIRGFGASSDLYLDGMRDNAQYNRDTFNMERIEILRGPSSMLFGRGSTGGVVNQVSKEAGLDLASNVSFTVGNYGYFRETADVSQNIGDSSAARINIMKTDNKSSRDVVKHDSWGVAPSLKFGIGTKNELLLAYSHLQYDDIPDLGIPIANRNGAKPISVPNDTFYGLGNVDYQKDSSDVFTLRHIHKIDANQEITTTLRKNLVERDLRAVSPGLASNGAVNRGRQARGAREGNTSLQTNYNSKFDLLSMKHEALLGFDYLYETASRWSYNNAVANPSSPQLQPDPYVELPSNYGATYQRINPIHFSDRNLGLSFQDTIELIPHWKLLAGLRYDDFSADYKSSTTSTGALLSYKRRDKVFSYRSGLMYQPSSFTTYYASYGTSFNPSGDLYSIEALDPSRSGNTPPEKSVNTEIGAKWELLDGDLSLRTALFRTEKTNERNTDQTNTSVQLLSGKRHTDGIELEASGRINSKWEIFGGIALMKSRIDKHINPYGVGLTPVNTPAVSGNFWNTYKINPNWKIGGGVDFVGERAGYSIVSPNALGVATPPTIRHIAGYARFDALLQWDNKQYSIKLNIFNLLDREYYDAIYTNGGFAIPGNSRSGQLTFSYKF